MKKITSVGCFVIILSFFILPCQAEDSPFNVTFDVGWNGCYRPLQWTPVELTIAAPTLADNFAGVITMSVQQDDLNTMAIAHEFVLMQDLPYRAPLVTKLDFAASDCTVSITNVKGRTQWRQTYSLYDYSQSNRMIEAVYEEDLFIGLVGQRKFNLLRLPDESYCTTEESQGKVRLQEKIEKMVPWDWTGLVSLDLLILYNPDWDSLRPEQLTAMTQWVSNGGRLLVVLGGRHLPQQHPLAQWLPFDLGQAKDVSFSEDKLAEWNLGNDQIEAVTGRTVSLKATARLGELHKVNESESLFATSYVGFGRVGVLGFDPANLHDSQRAQSSPFWVGRIRAILEDDQVNYQSTLPTDDEAKMRRYNRVAHRKPVYRSIAYLEAADAHLFDGRNDHQYSIGWAQAGSNAVMDHLYNIAEMRPLSIWWVILLLSLLAILLGPVDYIVLKRLDRQPMTWLTATGWIVLFTVGAYYGVQALRGGKMQLRAVTVTDGIAGDSHGWNTSYSGLFAPYSDRFNLSGLKENQWWSGMAPTETYLHAYGRGSIGRKIYCRQHDGANLIDALPLNIWTMQCLLTEAPQPSEPVQVGIVREQNNVVIEIRNNTEKAITRGYVLFDKDRMLNFDAVAPGESRRFEGPLRSGKKWESYIGEGQNLYYGHGDYETTDFEAEMAYSAQGVLQRTQAMKAFLAQGAAVVCLEFRDAPAGYGVEGHDYEVDHVQLVRLVVFPEDFREEIVQ